MREIDLQSVKGNIVQIPGFDDYYISDSGDVFSKRLRGREKIHRLRKLVPKNPGHPLKYLNVVLCRDGEQKTVSIHRLVAENFVDGYFCGAVVNHKDGNNRNNKADNLEWVTQKENVHKSYKTSGLNQKRNCLTWVLYSSNGEEIGRFDGNQDMCDYIKKSNLPISCSMLVKHHAHNGYRVETISRSRSCNDYPQGVHEQ